MDKKFNKVVELISTVFTSQDINPEPLFQELESLKQEILNKINQKSFSTTFDTEESDIMALNFQLENLQQIYIQNKIKLRLYQESLSLITRN
jgi:LysM repeat protein